MYISGPSLINQIKRDAQESRQQQSIAQALQEYQMKMAKWQTDEAERQRNYATEVGEYKSKKGWADIGGNILSGLAMNFLLPPGVAQIAGSKMLLPALARMTGKTVGGNILGDLFGGDAPTAPNVAAMPELDENIANTLFGRAYLGGSKSPLADIASQQQKIKGGFDEYSSNIASTITDMGKNQLMTGAGMAFLPELTNMMPGGFSIGDILGKDLIGDLDLGTWFKNMFETSYE